MEISKEKEYLYEMMKEVMRERRELTDIYYSLKKRLDSLTEMEEKGLTDLSIDGYVELHSRVRGRLEAENRRREIEYQTNKHNEEGKENNVVNPINQVNLVSQVSPANQVQIVQQARKEVAAMTEQELKEAVKEEEKTKVNITQEDIVRTKAVDQVGKPKQARRRTVMSDERAAGIVAEVLKEKGIPVKFDVIYEGFLKKAEIQPGEIKESSFRTNTFRRIMEINPKIQRVSGMRGYYQYIHS